MGWKRISLEEMFLLVGMGTECTIAEVRTRHAKPGHRRKPKWQTFDSRNLMPLANCQKVMADKGRRGWTFLFSVETE